MQTEQERQKSKDLFINRISPEEIKKIKDYWEEESRKPSPEKLKEMMDELEKVLDGRKICLIRPLTVPQINAAAVEHLKEDFSHLFIHGKLIFTDMKRLPTKAKEVFDTFIAGANWAANFGR